MRKKRKGFTLIEMLVVIAIIGIVTASSLALLFLFRGDFSLRKAGQVIKVAFANAQQRASARATVTFIVFNNPNQNQMQKYLDTNGNKQYDAGDRPFGIPPEPPVSLPRGVVFNRTPPWVGFVPAQGLILPSGFWDRNPARGYNDANNYDITLGESGGRTDLIGLDFSIGTGRILRIKQF